MDKDLKNKLYEYLNDKLGLRDYRRGWLKGNCPSCGRYDKFGVNLGMNKSNCFVCGYNPTPINLVMEMESFPDFRETIGFLKSFKGLIYIEPLVERIESIDVSLPPGFMNLAISEGRLGKLARTYITKRGFDPDVLGYKGWGYCIKGEYVGYIIIPFYSGNKLIYFNARRFAGVGPKYENPRIEDFGIGKSLVIYNMDALYIHSRVYLTEGAINAETMGDQGIAAGGKKVSHYQISKILSSSLVDEIILLLDPDAFEDAIKLGLTIIFYKKVKLIRLPGDQDVNDLGKEKTLKIIKRHKWLSYGDLLKMNNEHKKGSKFTYQKV